MAKNDICQECGMIVHPAEFHPIEFCVLWRNGYDPKNLFNRIVKLVEEDQESK